jgi:NAD(P)-dependent dehydrogenase (short-subunit alcohol dehydrogenase family)
MDLQLRGKRALVTGSTAGIGLAAETALYKEGASVVVNGRTKERVVERCEGVEGNAGRRFRT